MKFLICIFLFSLSVKAEILVRAPGASPKLYQEYLDRHLEFKSMVNFLKESDRNSTEGEAELLTLSDRHHLSAEELQKFVHQLRNSKIFSKSSWQYLADLLESRRKDLGQEFKKLEPLLCEALFYSEQEPQQNCHWISLNLADLKAQWPEAEGLFD